MAISAARMRAAEARRSEAITGAPESGRSPVDRGRGAFDGDVGAHALQLGRVHEAGRVDLLGDRAASVDEELEGHELRLQVRREAWVGFGDDLDGARRLAVGADEVGAGLDLDARFTELVEEGREVRRVAVRHRDVAAGDGAGHEVGAGFDAVGNDRMVAAVEGGDAFDFDDARALAADLGAHFDEHRAEVDDLRFAGGAFDARDAGRKGGGHHDISGAEDCAAHRAAHEDHVTTGAGGVDLTRGRLRP